MDDIIIARVLAVLMLIGGLPLVTGVVLRSIRRNIGPDEHLDAFQRIEPLFAPQTCFWGTANRCERVLDHLRER